MTTIRVGDLVRIKNSSTGDARWMVERYRDRTPLLFTQFDSFGDPYTGNVGNHIQVLDIDGVRKWVPARRVELVQ